MEQNTFYYAVQSCSPMGNRGGMILGKVTRGLKHVHLEEKRFPHRAAHRPLLPHICRAALPHLLTSSTCRPLFLSLENSRKANSSLPLTSTHFQPVWFTESTFQKVAKMSWLLNPIATHLFWPLHKNKHQRRQLQPTPVLLPGKSHGQRSLEGCSPWGRWGLDTTERIHFHFSLSCIREGNGNPLQCSCLENPRDRGAWWAAVYGVAQSQTWLKQLSSSSIREPLAEGERVEWKSWLENQHSKN